MEYLHNRRNGRSADWPAKKCSSHIRPLSSFEGGVAKRVGGDFTAHLHNGPAHAVGCGVFFFESSAAVEADGSTCSSARNHWRRKDFYSQVLLQSQRRGRERVWDTEQVLCWKRRRQPAASSTPKNNSPQVIFCGERLSPFCRSPPTCLVQIADAVKNFRSPHCCSWR